MDDSAFAQAWAKTRQQGFGRFKDRYRYFVERSEP